MPPVVTVYLLDAVYDRGDVLFAQPAVYTSRNEADHHELLTHRLSRPLSCLRSFICASDCASSSPCERFRNAGGTYLPAGVGARGKA